MTSARRLGVNQNKCESLLRDSVPTLRIGLKQYKLIGLYAQLTSRKIRF
jgi:hypothetical protein